MSEFKVEVVRIGKVEKLPNSDSLSITQIHGGYPVIFRTGDYVEGDLAIYVPVDALVPVSDPRWSFLVPEPKREGRNVTDEDRAELLRRYERERAGKFRIRAKKLRGTYSQGILTPLPKDEEQLAHALPAMVGADVQASLGIEKWEPGDVYVKGGRGGHGANGDVLPNPSWLPIYTDIEGLRRWRDVLAPGEIVVMTEKVHGENMRVVYHDDRLWVGSHKVLRRAPSWLEIAWYAVASFVYGFLPLWLRIRVKPPKLVMSNFWKVARALDLERELSLLPDVVFFGECHGDVKDLKYGAKSGELRFSVFDAYSLTQQRYLDYPQFLAAAALVGLEPMPELYYGPWSEQLWDLAEGKTTFPGADHVREGFVVRPIHERVHERLGRVILKLVGQGYLLRKEG